MLVVNTRLINQINLVVADGPLHILVGMDDNYSKKLADELTKGESIRNPVELKPVKSLLKIFCDSLAVAYKMNDSLVHSKCPTPDYIKFIVGDELRLHFCDTAVESLDVVETSSCFSDADEWRVNCSLNESSTIVMFVQFCVSYGKPLIETFLAAVAKTGRSCPSHNASSMVRYSLDCKPFHGISSWHCRWNL